MKKNLKRVAKGILPILLTAVFIISIYVSVKGMFLVGIPDISDVQKVSISYPDVSSETKEITDAEHIELAVKLANFLNYSVFERYAGDDEPVITITYFLTDGREVSVSASRNTVWWKGKAHVLKDKDMFINLTEGIFFLEDVVNN